MLHVMLKCDCTCVSIHISSLREYNFTMLLAARNVARQRLSFLLRQLHWFQHLLHETNQFMMALDDFSDTAEDAAPRNQRLHDQLAVLRMEVDHQLLACRMAIAMTEQRIQLLLR